MKNIFNFGEGGDPKLKASGGLKLDVPQGVSVDARVVNRGDLRIYDCYIMS